LENNTASIIGNKEENVDDEEKNTLKNIYIHC